MTELKLNTNIYEDGLYRFARKLSRIRPHEKLVIDICNAKYMIPSAILLLFNKCQYWMSIGVDIEIVYKDNSVHQYLQRMNFFTLLGYEDHEKFSRHNPATRFLPIVEFGPRSRSDQEIDKDPNALSTYISEIAMGSGNDDLSKEAKQLKFGLIWSSGELIMNAIQHSRGTGYVFAQYTPKTDYVRISILDNGIGILDSFNIQNSDHFKKGMTCIDAIRKALEYEVSSKPIGIGYENAGVGLTYLKGVVSIAGTDLSIISRNGFYNLEREVESETILCNGTLCSITLRREDLNNFHEIFREAQSI